MALSIHAHLERHGFRFRNITIIILVQKNILI